MVLNELAIGQRVYFEEMPLVVSDLLDSWLWHRADYPEVECSWIDRNGVRHTKNFKEAVLRCEKVITQKSIVSLPLLYSAKVNCYGWKEYASLIASNFAQKDEGAEREDRQTRFVYDFKKFGKHGDEIRDYLELLKAYFGVGTVAVVPSHVPVVNELQKLVGVRVFERVLEIVPRKYNHKVELAEDYESTYKVHWDLLREKKVLVVDDVVTSGVTLNHFAGVLEAKGYEVIRFGLGLNNKLPFEEYYRFFMKV